MAKTFSRSQDEKLFKGKDLNVWEKLSDVINHKCCDGIIIQVKKRKHSSSSWQCLIIPNLGTDVFPFRMTHDTPSACGCFMSRW